MVFCEKKYQSVRKKLDMMGYQQPMSVESLTLIEKLLSDLIRCQDSLQYYKTIANSATEKYTELNHCVLPYKDKNEKLIKENNELRHRFIFEEEQMKKTINELRNRIADLEQCNSDLEFLNNEHLTRIGEQQQQLCQRNNKILELEGITFSHNFVNQSTLNKLEGSKNSFKSLSENRKIPSQNRHKKYQPCQRNKQNETNTPREHVVRIGHQWTPSELECELKTLKKENAQLLERIEFQNDQIILRDNEIKRLGKELEKKIPVNLALSKYCVCHNTEEEKCLKELNKELENKLKGAQNRQHEAMLRAVCLAERIRELENKFASDSKKNMKTNLDKVESNELQNIKEKLNSCLIKIEELEEAVSELEKLNGKLQHEKEMLEMKLKNNDEKKDRTESGELHPKGLQSIKLQSKDFIKCDCSSHWEEKLQNQVQEIASIQAEHCRKLHPPEDLSTLNVNFEELRKKLVLKEDEVQSLRKRIQELESTQLKDSYSKIPLEINGKLEADYGNSLKEIDQLKRECSFLKDQVNQSQEERNSLRKKITEECEGRHTDRHKFEQLRLDLEGELQKLKTEKSDITLKTTSLSSEVRSLKEQCEKFRDQVNCMSIEKVQQTSAQSHLKLMLEQAERSLQNSQASVHVIEAELSSAIERIHELETEKNRLEAELSCVRSERCMLRGNISQLDHEKDSLLMKLDEKTEQLVQIKKDLKEKTSHLTELEHINSKLQSKLVKLEDSIVRNEQTTRYAAEEVERLRQQIASLQHSKDILIKENRRFQDDLASMTQDYIHSNCALESCKKEVEDLKTQLQGYVTEVKRVEDLLLNKESERADLLDHFRSLSMEATALETNNHSLENEAKTTKDSLKTVQDRLHDLELLVRDKDTFVRSMENQVAALTQQVVTFEMRIIELSSDKKRLESDLASSHQLSSTLENQKEHLNRQLHELEISHEKLMEEVSKLRCEHKHLEVQIGKERTNSTALENVLTCSRHETIQTSLNNQDLNQQIQDLKQTIQKLEDQICSNCDLVMRYQKECDENQQEIIELKREITNERYTRARENEGRSHSQTL